VKTDFSAQALADLEEIARFIARDDPAAAVAWGDKLVDRAEEAGQHPLAGRVVPEFGDRTLREVLLQGYRIVYRLEKKRIVVLTVIEGHRRLRIPKPRKRR
jgi:plasmid stabilization system protein ParE